jgi:hypothetical protein
VTAVQERPPTDPGAVKEEQPYVDTAPNRHTGLWLLGLLAVWVVGWAVLRGHNTLEMSFQDQTAFHRWLNDLRDSIQLAAAQGNWFFHGVIGNISDALDSVVNQLQRLLSTPAVPRPVPEIGWLGVLAVLAWVAYAVAGWRSSLMVAITVLVFGLARVGGVGAGVEPCEHPVEGSLAGPVATCVRDDQRCVDAHEDVALDVRAQRLEHGRVVGLRGHVHQVTPVVEHGHAGRVALAPREVDADEVHAPTLPGPARTCTAGTDESCQRRRSEV